MIDKNEFVAATLCIKSKSERKKRKKKKRKSFYEVFLGVMWTM